MTDPEALSGFWEAPDGQGGVVGIHLQLTTILPALAKTFVAAQSWGNLFVGLYQSKAPSLQPGDENYFSDSPRDGAHYEDDHLTLHSPNYDLDLRRIPGDGWWGRFHREGFDSTVTLRRPGSDIKRGHAEIEDKAEDRAWNERAWIVGTWRSGWMTTDMDRFTCLHVYEPAPGVFAGWSDSLTTRASTHATSDLSMPPYATERYGEPIQVNVSDAGVASITLNAYNGICCSHPFHAKSAGKDLMAADWQADLNQRAHQSYWEKIAGDSCLAGLP